MTVALITGSGSGLGRAMADHLAACGFRVFGGDLPELDVRSDDLVRAFVDRAMREAGRIDAIVNNAGYGLAAAVEETSLDEAKAQFDTNFFGVARLVKAVLPIMRAQGSGRIVNISSGAGITAGPFHAFYSASKFAVEGYTEALRHEVAPFGVHVSIVEPGSFRTNVAKSAKRASQPLDVYAAPRERVIQAVSRYCEDGSDPAVLARAIERILAARRPRLRYRVGSDVRMGFWMRWLLPEGMFMKMVARWYGLPSVAFPANPVKPRTAKEGL